MALIQLIYRSRSLIDPRRADSMRAAILSNAERLNRIGGITGCLAYTDAHFVQLLEGSPASVDATYVRIRKDIRHADVEILLTRPIRSRAFGDWSMAGFDLADTQAPGYMSTFGVGSGFSVETTPPPQLLLLLMALADRKRAAA